VACSEANDRGVAACGRIVANPDESAADRAAALVQLGNNDVTHGKLDEAIADYSGAIEFDANNALAYAARAIAFWRKNDQGRAVADYDRAAGTDAATLRDMTTANAELGAIGQFAAPISDAALLNEVRGRLYELNFDPDPLDAPSTDATSQAIRKFQQQSNLAPTGTATMGLLQQLRQAGTLQPWGTIVFDQKSGKWGMAWAESTRQAAVARARATCGDSSRCPVEISFFGHTCGAFAHSKSTGWAIDARDDIGKAKDAALTDCGKRGGTCALVASVCADGAERSMP
jgi:tetratricopeptide (TPR) repeat protein